MAWNSGLATAGLLAAGKKICWAASWVWTSLPMKLWPHRARPPATARVTARNRPATAIRRSKVLRFIVASLTGDADGSVRMAPGRCASGRPVGLACARCGGWLAGLDRCHDSRAVGGDGAGLAAVGGQQ